MVPTLCNYGKLQMIKLAKNVSNNIDKRLINDAKELINGEINGCQNKKNS